MKHSLEQFVPNLLLRQHAWIWEKMKTTSKSESLRVSITILLCRPLWACNMSKHRGNMFYKHQNIQKVYVLEHLTFGLLLVFSIIAVWMDAVYSLKCWETESTSFTLQSKHNLSSQHNKQHPIGWKHSTGNGTFLENK